MREVDEKQEISLLWPNLPQICSDRLLPENN